jgi:hypothetical protein
VLFLLDRFFFHKKKFSFPFHFTFPSISYHERFSVHNIGMHLNHSKYRVHTTDVFRQRVRHCMDSAVVTIFRECL